MGPPKTVIPESHLSVLFWSNNAVSNADVASGSTMSEETYRRYNVADAACFADYPNLRELALHLQTIPHALGLMNMLQLQRLSMTECSLESIQGLEGCVNLLHLDVSINRIGVMDPAVLHKLTNLQTLWMSDNRIRLIQGLERCTKLTTLWLARNGIRFVCDSLDHCTALTDLNLAATGMSNFKDIPNLARLRLLSSLALNDPHFGESPACSLCNYQTYLLFHLQQLQVLDTIIITDDARHLAEATFMKKKMYYNMRIKMLKRNTSNVVRKVSEVRQAKVSQINLNLNVLLRQLKDVERELHELGASKADGAASEQEVAQLHEKHSVLERSITQKADEISSTELTAAEVKKGVCESSQSSICRLMVELETGGNIRLEEGKPSDVWYSSCVDLVHSRFVAAEYAELGVTGLRVTRVTRVHNRQLRNRFEERLESMVNTSDLGYKRSLEYLFYAEPQRLPGEHARVMEEGFRHVEDYLPTHGHEAVPLSNSVSLCDRERLEAALSNALPAQRPAALSGKLLIAKVFLARCSQEKAPAGADASSEQSVPLRQADYSGFSSVYRINGHEGKQREWFVFEPELVLPEYLVELEYEPRDNKPEREPTAAQMLELGGGISAQGGSGATGASGQSEAEVVDLANLTRPLVRFAQQCTVSNTGDPCDDLCTAALNMPPALRQRAKLYRITQELLQQHAQMHSVSVDQLQRLNLHGNSIRKIEWLNGLRSLQELVLCFNEIHTMEGLEELTSLRRLELGFNLIKRIEGIRGLNKLEVLELNNNLIYRLEDMAVLNKCVPQLITLNLRNNAICEVKSYRYHVLRRLTCLTSLDDTRVLDLDRQCAAESTASITPNLIRAHAYARKRYNYSLRPNSIAEGGGEPLASSLGAEDADADAGGGSGGGNVEDGGKASSEGAASSNPFEGARLALAAAASNISSAIAEGASRLNGHGRGAQGSGADVGWWAQVEELELNHQHLRKLHDLERLVNLRRASFCNNDLTRLEGLDGCSLLEELSLEDNRIVKLENLSRLVFLTKLDLGKNKISRIEGLENLTALTQLSLEDNEITHLAGLAKVHSLLEVYIGNNRINDLKEVQQLKHLPKLIILDLSGNALAEATEYRPYTIYQLRKLKVLDGLGIEAGEQSMAKEMFVGKLTVEALSERLGHSFWEHVTELDLSRSKIRELDALHHEGFRNLRELNLDSNLMVSVHNLPFLPNLRALRLNHNLIQSHAPPSVPDGLSLKSGGLSALTALEVLHLGYNQITEVPLLHLHTLHKLCVLHLQGNDISRLDGLQALHQLRELILDRNKIRQLEPGSLSALANLHELRIEENGLRSLEHLAPLGRLQVLALGANRISDVGELDRLDHLCRSLTQLGLVNNPVARKQLYRPTLVKRLSSLRFLDGREVTPEERERAEVIFSSDRAPPSLSMSDQRQFATKVPLKLTSMSFEMMSGLSGPLAAQSQQLPHSAGHMPMGSGGGHGGGGSDWHPMSAPHEDFFLPSHAKQRGGGSHAHDDERSHSHAPLRNSRTHGRTRTASGVTYDYSHHR